MYRKLVFPMLLGLIGTTILLGLGIWQVKRLSWKNEILENIEQKIVAKPIALQKHVSEENDQFRSVEVVGDIQSKEIHVLTSLKTHGPGFLVISALRMPNGRSIMVDRGFVPEIKKNGFRSNSKVKITGNLFWPNEIDNFIPTPNFEKNIWFGRDLYKMAEYLETEPVLIVARNSKPQNSIIPQRVGANLSNNHLSYAITWFSLAAVWFGMTILLVYRIRNYDE